MFYSHKCFILIQLVWYQLGYCNTILTLIPWSGVRLCKFKAQASTRFPLLETSSMLRETPCHPPCDQLAINSDKIRKKEREILLQETLIT